MLPPDLLNRQFVAASLQQRSLAMNTARLNASVVTVSLRARLPPNAPFGANASGRARLGAARRMPETHRETRSALGRHSDRAEKRADASQERRLRKFAGNLDLVMQQCFRLMHSRSKEVGCTER